jgi:polyisoprenoid-binding protein YceI
MGRKYLVILLALIIACSALMIGAPQAQAAGPWYVDPTVAMARVRVH